MPRTDLTVTISAAKAVSPPEKQTAGVTLVMAGAAAATTMNQFAFTGRELVIARNTATQARTVTITSAADTAGRLGHITADSIPAGAIRIYGPFPEHGWRQTDGKGYLEASATDVEFGVAVLP